MPSHAVIDYRGSFSFNVPPGTLWSSIESGERFESWWGWLHDFRLEGGRLRQGAVLHGVVAPPLPYRMRLRVEVERCDAPRHVDASVHGDLEGHAHLVLRPVTGAHDRDAAPASSGSDTAVHGESGAGTLAEVAWTIEMMQPAMRVAARVAGPLLRWGHDRVVEATVHGYRRFLHEDP